ncbi:MAG: peptidoglycan editing factor PgeF [Pyrinomonadaceae bacterium]
MSIPIETITKSVQSPKFKVQSFNEDLSLTENSFYWREKNGIKVLVCRALKEKGFVNGFSTRLGGVSDFPKNSLNLAGYNEDSTENIEENRRRFLRLFDGDFKIASCWQIHSADVRVVKTFEDFADGNQKFDALVSNLENVLLGAKTADCVPVLLGDAKTKAFAAIHAGWRGTAGSIVKNACEKMRAHFGTNPKDLICAIGPAASGKNYEIGQNVIDAFRENFSQSKHLFTPTRSGHAFVNLPLANQEQLISVGVLPENIHVAPLCTIDRIDLFFSYRAEGKTGRLMSIIGLN